jgi:hypothetical protein
VSGCGSGSSASGGGSAPDDPKQTLKQLVKYVGEGKSVDACGLLVPGAQATFATENKAKDCKTAMDVYAGKVTDGKKFAAYEPTGLKVDGETATIGGSCAGWEGPVPYAERPGITPDEMGQFLLKKTDKGWFVNDYKGKHRLSSSCGG